MTPEQQIASEVYNRICDNIKVINVRTATTDELARAEYIGRPNKQYRLKGSPLANPFAIHTGASRKEVLEKYEDWYIEHRKDRAIVDEIYRLARRAIAGEEVLLACWCAPRPCHGDYIRERIILVVRSARIAAGLWHVPEVR